MSTLIRVEEVKPIEVGLILPKISKALRLILGLTYDPLLLAVDRIESEKILPESYLVKSGAGELIGIKSVEEQAIVTVSMHEDAKHVYISPDGWRTGFEYALAAGVAVALAEYSDSEISDSALRYTQVFSQPADMFVQTIKAERTYNDVNHAAQDFEYRLGWK